ncbi:DNA polymerase Y family protein [Ghiorsea bivora]|uniref:DNA polymerase Y family protein n=1 Tax=Ghiorsea bivora TaxID=1485545 RepID=UPI000571EC1D|nr:DNA polymerase IV [Ghiorsea bivora]
MNHTRNWYNAIAHIDADCFYASCELTRRPDLKGQPVCILSSQDACVVAKTYDAKAIGIKTGMPVWDAKKLMPHAHFLSADFRYYGLISKKMFSILRRYSPNIEEYSIDEGFVDMNGIRSMWDKSYRGIADDIRRTVYDEVGITVSVGISTTRILSKIASEMNKPNGSTIIPGRRIANFLREVPVGDIPGIGGSRKQLMKKLRIQTAFDFTNTPLERIDMMLGKVGVDLWNELNGNPVFELELEPPMPKSIARTASLGSVTHNKQLISTHITYHTTRVVTELVRKGLTASVISVFLRLKSFESIGQNVRITATNDYSRINHIVKGIFNHIFRDGVKYRACGVVATSLQPDVQQGDLFAAPLQTSKQLALTKVMNDINTRFGNQVLRPANSLKKETPKVKFQYPLLIAK